MVVGSLYIMQQTVDKKKSWSISCQRELISMHQINMASLLFCLLPMKDI
ncbi:unnamed protein product [Staurois parvus]|uniref:Uncharacterized protein n=1 Tax=Staurois parvus TaxID=386267 RepID=A0ABN9CJD3_9NEOB|nr:unnamed protein product [Staurois parvus]